MPSRGAPVPVESRVPPCPEREDALKRQPDPIPDAGALGVAVSGSGPTCFGLFTGRAAAEEAAKALPGALVSDLR